MAPLMDERGNVRYHVGAQIDITPLLEGGKGLESLKQLFDHEKEAANISDPAENKLSLKLLRQLGGLLNEEEADVVRQRSYPRGSVSSTASGPRRPTTGPGRRFVGMEETAEDNLWPAGRFGSEGRLPGVYQNVSLLMFLGLSVLTCAVPPRAAIPLAPHHLHLAFLTHTRPLPIETYGPHRRPSARPRWAPGSPRPRFQRHSQSLLADAEPQTT
jgi:hypothetical protein